MNSSFTFSPLLHAFVILLCYSTALLADIVHLKPGDNLQKALDQGHDIALQKGAIYPITQTLILKKQHQKVFTADAKTISDYAELKLTVPNVSRILDANGKAGVHIENITFNGNRYAVPVGRHLDMHRKALVFLGGRGAIGQTLRSCVFLNPRSWSTLKVHEGGRDIVVDRNIILGAGSDCRGNGIGQEDPKAIGDGHSHYAWGDGISCAAENSTVTNNIIIDPTDVGVVVFGAPGTQVRNNVVSTISRESLGGINLVDALVYDIGDGSRWDYRGVQVTNNLIDAFGARIHMAIPMGVAPWAPGRAGNVLVGAEVSHNHITGGAGGYGMVAREIDGFNIHSNISTATYSGLPDGVGNRLPERPGPFYVAEGTIGNSHLQSDFKGAQRHLEHLLRCNHGPVDDKGFRQYGYGDEEIEAVVHAAYIEMLGRKANIYELTKWVRWQQKHKGRADRIRREITNTKAFKSSMGEVPHHQLHSFRTALWFELMDHAIGEDTSAFSASDVYQQAMNGLKDQKLRHQIKTAIFDRFAHLIAPLKAQSFATHKQHLEVDGKVFAGYQGWFGAVGDGFDVGFDNFQYAWKFEPGTCVIDYWPDMSEFDQDEWYPTPFKYEDGSTAHIFSSAHPKTVDRHFQWMKDYDIDGAFLQRFGWALRPRTSEKHPDVLAHRDRVYDNVYKAAEHHQRLWTMMYDLTGLNKGDIAKYVINDFKNMIDKRGFKDHPTLMHHRGKPLISIWGIGFDDGRSYSLKECMELVKFFKEDPVYGGFSVLIGVPYYWRSQTRDTMDDPLFMEIVKAADIIHPWSPGRYQSPEQMKDLQKTMLEPDIAWAEDHNLDYMPVIFPGFSWHNLEKAKGKHAELNSIPRLGGQFVWSQAVAAKRAGANMIYLAMFDEMNEGTCFFKVSKRTPVGKSPFISYDIDGLPSDHYLWLSGQMRRLLRNEIPTTDQIPVRRSK